MLTKGDILTYLGKTSGPSGTYKESPSPQGEVKKPEAKPEPKVRDLYSRRPILFDGNNACSHSTDLLFGGSLFLRCFRTLLWHELRSVSVFCLSS